MKNWAILLTISLEEILVAYKIGRITLEDAIWIINKKHKYNEKIYSKNIE